MLVVVTQYVTAQETFVTEGETTVYKVFLDESIQKGTVSDALQNLPGVRVDMEGNIVLRGVSSVEIFINDQPSHFSEEAQKNYLQQTLASDIQEIRVMTNPSSRYTTQSNTGVINIITKENTEAKRNLNVGFRANTLPEYSPWISYSYNKNKWSFSANFKGNYSKINNSDHSYGYSYGGENHEDTLNITRNFGKEEMKSLTLNADFQLGYKINEKNNLTFYLTGEMDDKNSNSYDSTYRKDTDVYEYITTKDYDFRGYELSAGMAYVHDFNDEGHSIVLSLNTFLMPGHSEAVSSRHYKSGNAIDRTTRERNIYSDIHWDAKVDYTWPYSKNGEFFVGLRKTHNPDGNELLFDTLAGDDYVRDTLMTEIRRYSTDKNEVFINLQHRLGKFTVKPGVSFEYTEMTAKFPNEGWYDFNKNFFKVHPSVYVTYTTDNQHVFSIGYTHKTDFPWVRKFSPRILYQEDSYDVGNPDLKPASMNVFRAEWTKYWQKFGSVGINAYYKGTTDAINDVQYSDYNPIYGRYVIYNKPVNLGGYYDAGAELNVTYRPTAMLNVRLYANLYESHLEYPVTEQEIVKSDMFCYNFTLNIWTKVMNKVELHASAYYNSETQTLFSHWQKPYGIDCGLRIDFFQNRMSLLVNVNDLFDWNKTDNTIRQPDYEYFSSQKTTSRFVSAEIIFRII